MLKKIFVIIFLFLIFIWLSWEVYFKNIDAPQQNNVVLGTYVNLENTPQSITFDLDGNYWQYEGCNLVASGSFSKVKENIYELDNDLNPLIGIENEHFFYKIMIDTNIELFEFKLSSKIPIYQSTYCE